MKLKVPGNLAGGILLLGFGVAVMAASSKYELGSLAAMGPGYFPTVLGGIVAVLGMVLVGQGAMRRSDVVTLDQVGRSLLVPGAIVAFALLAEPAGLLVAVLAVVMISSLAADDLPWFQAVMLAVLLAGACVAIFIYGLGLTFNVWPAQWNY